MASWSPLTYYFIILFIIILIVIALSIMAIYQYRYEMCRYNPSPWCFYDWTCDQTNANICPPDANCGNTGSCYVRQCECDNLGKPAHELKCILQGCKTTYVDASGNPCTEGDVGCTPSFNATTCQQPFNQLNQGS